ncbi:hypothetical protein PIB30_061397 [Stylosanthes scabra]|uniref:Uncharacterized protein n=1 Tax=Stylosanthes scabra TaxID=79078 RepID=A0ABU6RLL5_9FABA|nr:hypothetical protein [Stylosanthes scabra]
MVSISTWFRYVAHKFEYSISVGYKNYKGGHITDRELGDVIWKNFFQGKLTYTQWVKGDAMAPTIAEKPALLLIRKLPIPEPK